MIHRQRYRPPGSADAPQKYDDLAITRMMPEYLARARPIGSVAAEEYNALRVGIVDGPRSIATMLVNGADDAVGRVSRMLAAAAAARGMRYDRRLTGLLLPVREIIESVRVAREVRKRANAFASVAAEVQEVGQAAWQAAYARFLEQQAQRKAVEADATVPLAVYADCQQQYNASLHALLSISGLVSAGWMRKQRIADGRLDYASSCAAARRDEYPDSAEHIQALLWLSSDSQPGMGGKPLTVEAALDPKVIDKKVMKIERLPLTHAPMYARARRRLSVSSGYKLHMPRVPSAAISGSTSRLFRKRVKTRVRGGSVLVDWSASMALSVAQILQMLDQAPAAHIAYYNGADDNVSWRQAHHGTLRIVAEHGRRLPFSTRKLPSDGHANAVDLWALLWLLEQPAPRIFVTDYGFTGPAASSAMALVQAAEARGAVKVVYHIGDVAALLGRPRAEEIAS